MSDQLGAICKKYFGVLSSIVAMVFSVIGILTAPWRSVPLRTTFAVADAVVLGLLAILVFARRDQGAQFGAAGNFVGLAPKKIRITAAVIGLALVAVWPVQWATRHIPVPRENKIVVLVGPFRGVDEEKYGVQQVVADKAKDALSFYRGVEIRSVPKENSTGPYDGEANREVASGNADVVLWGTYLVTSTSVYVRYHLLARDRDKFEQHFVPSESSLILGGDQFNRFTVQAGIANRLVLQALVSAAAGRLASRDDGEAADILKEALRRNLDADPRTLAELFYFKAVIEEHRGDGAIAIADYLESLRHERRASTLLSLGNAYGHLHRFREAASSYRNGLKLDSSCQIKFELRGNLASIALLQLNSIDAFKNADAAVSLSRVSDCQQGDLRIGGDSVDPRASALVMRAEAERHLHRVEPALTDLLESLRIQEGWRARYTLGSLYAQQNAFSAALEQYQHALRDQGERQDSATLLKLGDASLMVRAYNNALEYYSEAARRGATGAFLGAAQACIALGRFATALEHVRTAEFHLGPSANSEFIRGIALLGLSDYRGAMAALQYVYEREPTAQFILLDLGAAASGAREESLAVQYYTAYLELNPSDGDGYFSRAIALERQGLLREAFRDYRVSAKYYTAQGRYADALDANRKAYRTEIERKPEIQ